MRGGHTKGWGTYLPYLWETKKEIMGCVKVGYYTN